MLKRATLFNVRTYIPFEFPYAWGRRGRDDLAGLRDRALFLLGLAGALRRAELVGIDREQLQPAACSLQRRACGCACRRARAIRPARGWNSASRAASLGTPARRGPWRPGSSARRRFGPLFRKVDQWATSNMPGSAHRTPVTAGAARRLGHGGTLVQRGENSLIRGRPSGSVSTIVAGCRSNTTPLAGIASRRPAIASATGRPTRPD